MNKQFNRTGEVYYTKNPVIKLLSRNWTNRIAALLNKINVKTKVGIDIGCAEGYMIERLHKNFVIDKIIGIDTDISKLKIAKKKAPYYEFSCQDASNTGFKDNTFDYIIATEILEHVHSPEQVMNEMNRILKNNGHIILSVPHEPFFHIGNIIRGKYLDKGGKTPSHLHFWNLIEFKNFLKPFVEIIDKKYITTFPWMVYVCRFKNENSKA